MCRSRLIALRPEPRRELQASAEGFTEEHIAAQFSEPWCSATFRVIPSTWERIDTAPHISLHLPPPATTYHLAISRHLTTTVSVRSALPPANDAETFHPMSGLRFSPAPGVQRLRCTSPYQGDGRADTMLALDPGGDDEAAGIYRACRWRATWRGCAGAAARPMRRIGVLVGLAENDPEKRAPRGI